MTNGKVLFILFLLVSLSITASAFVNQNNLELEGSLDYDGPGLSSPSITRTEYGTTVEGEIIDYSGSLNRIEVKCGGETVAVQDKNNGLSLPYTFDFKVPQGTPDNPCDVPRDTGYQYNITLTSGGQATKSLLGTVYVSSQGDMNPHAGENLIVNYDEENGFYAFQLSDDAEAIAAGFDDGSPGTGGDQPGRILVQQFDGSLGGSTEKTSFLSGLGNRTSEGGSLKSLVRPGSYLGICGDIAGTPKPGTCDVIDKTYFSSTYRVEPSTIWNDELDTISPVYRYDDYIPGGEIIYAKQPVYAGNDNQKEKFFICRDGAKMENSNGNFVDQVINIGSDSQDLKQCEPSTGQWEDVEECGDGLDNDGDGKIDDNDPDCANGGSESPSGSCDILSYDSNDNIQLNYTPSSGSCVSETLNSFIYDSDGNLKSPETFTCDGANAENKGGEAVPPGNQYDEFCTAPIDDPHGGEIQVVEFYPTKQSLEAIYGTSDLEEGVNIENEVPPTGFDNNARYFIGEDGWQSGLQTLHQAEGMYGSGNLHSELTWSVKGMVNTGGYDGSGEYSDAWAISNGGSPFNEVEDTQFHGGFHGKCGSGEKWIKKQGIWRCSGAGAQGIQVNFYNLDPENTDGYVGFELNASQASNWGELYGVPAVPSSGGVDNLEIKARCWQGEPAQRPTNQDDIISLSKPVTNDDEGSGNTNIIAGQLPATRDWSGVGGPAGGTDTYSCNFGFQQEVFFPNLIPSNDDVFDETGSLVTNPLSCDTSGRCFIIAGSDQNIVPVTVNQKYVISSADIQDKLENAAATTDNVAYDSVFNPFPGELSGVGSRNPFDLWKQDYGN